MASLTAEDGLIQNGLFSRPMSEVLWWCVGLYWCYSTHRCCSFAIAISWADHGDNWHRRPTRTIHSVSLPQFLRVRTNNLEQISTWSTKHRQGPV